MRCLTIVRAALLAMLGVLALNGESHAQVMAAKVSGGNVTFNGSGFAPGVVYLVQVINYSDDPDGNGRLLGPNTEICASATNPGSTGKGGGSLSGSIATPRGFSAGEELHLKVFRKSGGGTPIVDVNVIQPVIVNGQPYLGKPTAGGGSVDITLLDISLLNLNASLVSLNGTLFARPLR